VQTEGSFSDPASLFTPCLECVRPVQDCSGRSLKSSDVLPSLSLKIIFPSSFLRTRPCKIMPWLDCALPSPSSEEYVTPGIISRELFGLHMTEA